MPVVITTVSNYSVPIGGNGTTTRNPPIGQLTSAPPCPVPVASIEFSAQLLLVDSPLPTFFCFISCSVFVSDSSPSSNAYAVTGCVENIPVNAAAIKTVAIASFLFITYKVMAVIISEFTSYVLLCIG
jgi:hypothetical protein